MNLFFVLSSSQVLDLERKKKKIHLSSYVIFLFISPFIPPPLLWGYYVFNLRANRNLSYCWIISSNLRIDFK